MRALIRVLLLQEDADNSLWVGIVFALYMFAISAGITLGAIALSK